MGQNARITTTISGVVTDADLEVRLNAMEERIMSALSDAVATMRTAVEGVSSRLGDSGALEAAVAAERARFDELVATEAAEDVTQDADLQAARAEVDRLVAEQSAAAGELTALADQLDGVGTAVDAAPDGTPVEEVDVPEVVAPDAPVDAPVDAPAPDAPVDDAADPDVPPAPPADDAAPAPTPGPGGPVDADGNPVDGPAL